MSHPLTDRSVFIPTYNELALTISKLFSRIIRFKAVSSKRLALKVRPTASFARGTFKTQASTSYSMQRLIFDYDLYNNHAQKMVFSLNKNLRSTFSIQDHNSTKALHFFLLV